MPAKAMMLRGACCTVKCCFLRLPGRKTHVVQKPVSFLSKNIAFFFAQALCLFSVSNQINRVPRKSPPVCFRIKDRTPLPMTIKRGRQEWPDGAAFTGEWRENYAEATGAFAPYEILEGYRKVYGDMGNPL